MRRLFSLTSLGRPWPAMLAALLVVALLMMQTPARADDFVAVPELSAHVIDQVHLLDDKQRATLNNVLTEYETRTGSQIVVLLMASTAPEAIEQYSIRAAEAWQLGRKGVDDGVILVVAKDNPKSLRRLRIEVGRGVQGSLTDAQSKRILEDIIAPHFRQNDYYGGLAAGVSAITSLMDKEQLPGKTAAAAQEDNDGWTLLFGVVFVLTVFFAFLMMSRRSASRRNLNSNDWGNAAGVIIGSILEQSSRRGSGGFSSTGGFTSSGSSGGFSSNDSFSGGGGSFDGGGASGDW